jgi:hypothetical protein
MLHLALVQNLLLAIGAGVADSLAGHFGEWGAVSRFTAALVPSTAKSDTESDTKRSCVHAADRL